LSSRPPIRPKAHNWWPKRRQSRCHRRWAPTTAYTTPGCGQTRRSPSNSVLCPTNTGPNTTALSTPTRVRPKEVDPDSRRSQDSSSRAPRLRQPSSVRSVTVSFPARRAFRRTSGHIPVSGPIGAISRAADEPSLSQVSAQPLMRW
jgi:hypothetical protein